MTVESFFNQVTDLKQIVNKVKEMLRAVDPKFAEEEQNFQKAAKELMKTASSIVPSAEDYLAALEECYAYELLYICWQGFQYNLDCFVSPVNTFGKLKERLEMENGLINIRNIGQKSLKEIKQLFFEECYAKLLPYEKASYWQTVVDDIY